MNTPNVTSQPADSIEGSGFPLGFLFKKGTEPSNLLGTVPASNTIIVESRMLRGHQREAVVREGRNGNSWRLTCDEGKQLKGTDLAPFPLGYFNAGLHSDLMGRIIALAAARSIVLDDVSIEIQNHYWLKGSFFRGTGEGFADPAIIIVKLLTGANAAVVRHLINDAVAASPALGAMRKALTNTFALYVNGRRRTMHAMDASTAADAPDPYATYRNAPIPIAANIDEDIVRKTGVSVAGDVALAPNEAPTRAMIPIHGRCKLIDPAGFIETDTWVNLPGLSNFAIRSDERRDGNAAPSGLSLLSAGIAFCFMTQLGRYIEHMKFDIDGIRLVQYAPYSLTAGAEAMSGQAGPVDTHLFLNGRAEEDTYERLMQIAARTCYLHAALSNNLEPQISIELNGISV